LGVILQHRPATSHSAVVLPCYYLLQICLQMQFVLISSDVRQVTGLPPDVGRPKRTDVTFCKYTWTDVTTRPLRFVVKYQRWP
jgi:hypothetical protein